MGCFWKMGCFENAILKCVVAAMTTEILPPVIARSASDEAIHSCFAEQWIASSRCSSQ
jgi:hypothetical protein